MENKTSALIALLLAVISIQAVSSILDGQLDLGNLYNYAHPDVPDYIFSEETHDRDLTDEIATLGRVLFYEKQLSLNSSIACAGCHKQEFAFGDTTIASPGFDEKLTERHSTRLVNLNFSHMPEVFWDRRAGHLDSLPLMVLSNSIEMGFSGEEGQPDVDSLVRRVSTIDYYEPLFELAYGDKEVTAEKMNLALTQFVRSIVSYDSKYDVGRAMVDSNTVDFPNFSALENQGKRLFQSPFGEELTLPMTTLREAPQGPVGPNGLPQPSQGRTYPESIHPEWSFKVKGKMGCADCHGIDNFTSRKTSLTGNNGIIDVLHHPGEIDTTVKRSPSLRDLFNPNGIEIGPYMHDGSIATLEGVMDHYAEIGFPGNKTIGLHSSLDVTAPNNDFYTGPASGAPGPGGGGFGFVAFDQFPHFLDPRIDDQETEALIAFLKTLSGTKIYTDEKWSDPFGENGELILTNNCQPRIGTMEMTICEGDVFEGFHTTGIHEKRMCQPDGCDSIVRIDLTVSQAPEIFLAHELCLGDSFYGYNSDIQTTTMKSASVGCDTVVHLDISVIQPIFRRVYPVICEGTSYLGHTVAGNYVDTLQSVITGCDSIVSSRLVVTPPDESYEELDLCEGMDHYGYTASGRYIDTLYYDDGCSYLRVLDLIVYENPKTDISAVICEGESYEGYDESGVYTDVYLAAFTGCDSIRTLTLTVNRNTESLHEGVICEGESFMGYTESGIYSDMTTNANGCDSLIFIDVTVNVPTESWNEVAICDGDSYEGYRSAGEFLDVLVNHKGCDSMRTISLTILEHTESSYDVAICEGEDFEGYSTEGTYIDILTNRAGCDSTRQISIEVLQPSESYEEVHLCIGEDFEGKLEGDYDELYINSVGCDSLRHVSIVNIAADDPICSNAFDTTPSRITDTNYIRVGPNPVINYLDINIDKPNRLPATLKIINSNNQLLSEKEITDTHTQVDFASMEPGVYIVYLEQGANVFLTRLVKI